MAVTEASLIEAGIAAGLVDPETLPTLRLQARRERIRLLEAVTRAGRFPEAALYQALARQRGMIFLLPKDLVAVPELLEKLPDNVLQRRPMLPVRRDGELLLALGDPDDRLSPEIAERATGERLRPALAAPEALRAALRRQRGGGPLLATPEASGQDATGLLDTLMKDAYLRRATDLHFEPEQYAVRVRERVDGHLLEYPRPLTLQEGEAVVTRIKVLANLDIGEQRLPQDGSMSYRLSQWDTPPMDVRVATAPTRWGERVTMRLLGAGTTGLNLERLGMPPPILGPFREAINRPYGIILVTGPTGSGKSTTLYAALRELDADDLNILTVEDPIEQVVAGISQVQVSTKVDFALALRSFLRHDPDVILVGEVRDLETAETAMKAAMTGHLVLATLHTNDAVGAVTRLADIGVPYYLIGATLIGVMAQRLVRRLCQQCREPYTPDADERRRLGGTLPEELTLYRPVGCPACLGTGFAGRVGLYEALWVDRPLGELIATGAREDLIRQTATDRYYTLWQDGCSKVLEGAVTLAEVERLVPPDAR
ncbi:GspE/PulE family protein [Thiocystis violascens]|uniref:Type II secretory pathway, ATPase PulE/Tfp pilus assembly pathway, ATPase PilB n=1 Tax=Thiocystis violascens (strain ATCC 17096 / DSM 198 / 6111) TaxID=765911 RepID=I3Y5I8_THIV6|nr:GspE/PulE family protein [Thiocystis violascens]AFL72256.1 type II secretory pathway, ATPase PulE/Tfp pilus assembly pathway, ATPase PilB [Thiocystis violascens DSM 198]